MGERMKKCSKRMRAFGKGISCLLAGMMIRMRYVAADVIAEPWEQPTETPNASQTLAPKTQGSGQIEVMIIMGIIVLVIMVIAVLSIVRMRRRLKKEEQLSKQRAMMLQLEVEKKETE